MFIATQPRLPNVVIVSPALASANNGNWQTAKRYAKMLSAVCQVRIVQGWDGEQADDVLIALHARRSYTSIAAWHAARGAKGLIVVLIVEMLIVMVNMVVVKCLVSGRNVLHVRVMFWFRWSRSLFLF